MREIFDQAVGASPPSRIDIDAIVARKRRQVALRSGAVVAAAACGLAVALTGAAVAVHAFGTRSGMGTVGGAGNPPATARVSPTPSPPPLPSRPAETPTQVENRLANTLTRRLTALMPGVQINDRTTKHAGIAVRQEHADGVGQSYGASVRLINSAGSGTFDSLSAQRSESPTPSPTGPVTTRPEPPTTCEQFWAGSQTAPAHPDDQQCTASVGPQGQIVLATIDKLDAQAIRYEVVVLWARSYVDVTLDNFFVGWLDEGDPPDQKFLPAPQLPLTQLVTLAEDPDLGI